MDAVVPTAGGLRLPGVIWRTEMSDLSGGQPHHPGLLKIIGSVALDATIDRLVALERRVAELEAALNKEATSPHTQGSVEQEDPDYTCPNCEGDELSPCNCSRGTILAAANRKIRELEAENDRFRDEDSRLVRNAHREALESAAKMLDGQAPVLSWAFHAARLVRNHKVTP